MDHPPPTAPADNCRVEIRRGALEHNTRVFRELVGPERELMAVVKGDAYGHGMVDTARAALGAGASWLGVFWHGEGLALRDRKSVV